jgi:hypothetical protein
MTAKIRELKLEDLKIVAGGATLVATSTTIKPTYSTSLTMAATQPVSSVSWSTFTTLR